MLRALVWSLVFAAMMSIMESRFERRSELDKMTETAGSFGF